MLIPNSENALGRVYGLLEATNKGRRDTRLINRWNHFFTGRAHWDIEIGRNRVIPLVHEARSLLLLSPVRKQLKTDTLQVLDFVRNVAGRFDQMPDSYDIRCAEFLEEIGWKWAFDPVLRA